MARTCSRVGLAVIAVLAAAVAGCALEDQTKPSFVGPSELALSLNISASPDTLPQDGASQSVVMVEARNASSEPAANVSLKAEIQCVDSTGKAWVADYGALSVKSLVTGLDGRTTTIYTAPTQGAAKGVCDPNNPYVTIAVTPVGTNYVTAVTRYVVLRLTYPEDAPRAIFSYSPASPGANQEITFNGTASTAPAGRQLVFYDWDFGTARYATGPIVSKTYATAGTYTVTLTVTDDLGRKGVTWKNVTVK